MKNENKILLKNILSDLRKYAKIANINFDLASLKNCLFNYKVSGDSKYLNSFFDYEQNEKAAAELLIFIKDNNINCSLTEIKDLHTNLYEICNPMYKENGKKKLNKFRKLKPCVAEAKINIITIWKKENRNKETVRYFLFGSGERQGLLSKILIYGLLILFGFVFLYPFIYIFSYSFMSSGDLVNPTVTFIPKEGRLENYAEAIKVLKYGKRLGQTLLVSVLPSICTAISCSLAAYGLARYEFRFKKLIFGVIIFTFIIPSCLTMIPTLILFKQMHLTGTIMAYILPALFGQGIKSAVFILIFYIYFKSIPQSVIEASQIDGANTIRIFIKIAIPSAKTAFLLTFLFSIVWYYNETVLASVFFGSAISTLPLGLQGFKASFDSMYSSSTSTGRTVNEAIYMAGTVLNILPLVILYFFTQRHFTKGIDMAGITGE